MNAPRLRVLIIGGYGNFGARLARLLAEIPEVLLLVTGRSVATAVAFARELGSDAEGFALDRDGDLYSAFAGLRPDLVIDASGPFQVMADDGYKVVRACLALGIDYADLADSREFVAGIVVLDRLAKAKGIFALSGLSSFPALSFAAVDAMAPRFQRVEGVSSGIAPSPRAGIGLNVIRAIASYAGKPVMRVRDGRPSKGHGLIDRLAVTIAPPGAVPLRERDFLLVDAPDLALLPARFGPLRSTFTGAGTEPKALQSLLRLAAFSVRLGAVSGLLPFASVMHRASRLLGFGEHRGGMFVRLDGIDTSGERRECSWYLVAEGEDGPFIPILGMVALVRKIIAGVKPAAGARPATGALQLSDFEREFGRLAIATGIREEWRAKAPMPLYRRVLGEAWNRLPAAVAALHRGGQGERTVSGRARIERGSGVLASIMARVIGFPEAAEDVTVRVRFVVEGEREIWTRDFAGRQFHSMQVEGKGRDRHLLCEVFGPFSVQMALVIDGPKLRMVVRGWRFLGIPLPLFLAPGGDTYEEERDGRFHFHVEIAGRLTGLVVRYTGWLAPEENGPAV